LCVDFVRTGAKGSFAMRHMALACKQVVSQNTVWTHTVYVCCACTVYWYIGAKSMHTRCVHLLAASLVGLFASPFPRETSL
jgi:hypothetical protein